MRILTLDISTNCGYCVGGPGAVPRFGTFKLPAAHSPDDYGNRGAAFSNWLSDMITVHQPQLLSFEAPLVIGGPTGTSRPTSVYTVRLLLGLAFMAETIATMRDVECREAVIQTVRKFFCGSGHAKKPDVLAECVRRGWPVADDNQADAGAVWAFEMACAGFDTKPLSSLGGTDEGKRRA